MTAQTYSNLRTRALQVMNETAGFANSEVRVGSLLRDMVDSFPTVTVLTLAPSASDATTAAANTAALQAAVLAAHADGGGRIVIPPGDFYFQHGFLDVNVVCQIDNLDYICIEGSGVGVTRLHIINGAEANMFNLTGGSSFITIRNMEIDGNRANQTLGVHGIRGDAFSGLWLDSLYIHDTYHYGIGIEGFVQEFLFFSNIKIKNVGGDGFDQKNKSDANLWQCATGITVENFGLNLTLPTQAGWDCRGAWQLSDMVIHFSVADGSGIRFRNGETGTPAGGGFGGHRCHLSNIEIYGPGAASTSTGIEAVARDCVTSGVYIRDVLYGVVCAFDTPTGFGCSRSKFKGVTVENYGTAAFLTSAGANDNDFEDCTAIGSGTSTYGFRLRSSGSRLINPRASGNATTDCSLDTAATDTEIIGPRFIGTGSPGAAVTGLDVAGARCTVQGGTISGHTTNCSVSAADFQASATRFKSATTTNLLLAAGGDDARAIGCEFTAGATRNILARAARLQVVGGKCTDSAGTGLQTEASATDTLFSDVYMSGNTADFDDVGSNTTVVRHAPVAKAFNEAVAAAGTSANIDTLILPSTTVTFVVEANAEDSASARRTIRTKVQAYRSGSGGAVVSAGTNEFTTGAGTLTINLSASGNNMRVNVTNGGANNVRLDTRIWEVAREKTVEFS